jgi:4-amino-4-deoxy-L-arabinose transferase-like glycosyltransferase
VGGYDAAYVRGFFDPERSDQPGAAAELQGSDGSARWTHAESHLLLPQAGLPARLQLRMRSPDGGPVEVEVLLNGAPAERVMVTPAWRDVAIALPATPAVLLKPEDVLITLRAAATARAADDPRQVGVLIDRALFEVGPLPVLPFPSQILYGALAGALLAALWPVRARWVALLGLGLAFLLLYRLQPPYPYPLRGLLPSTCIVLGALLAVRRAPALALRWPALPDLAAGLGLALWLAAIAARAREHLVLSVPGVEKDFRVFATRATLPEIFRADGFYNLGYPLLLWLARPLVGGNAFLAAQIVAAVSGAVLLAAGWWLARAWLGGGPGLLAGLMLATSPLAVEYALYIGSDMPFAALCTLALALLLRPVRGAARLPWLAPALAGLAAGAAFLVRHPGAVLLPLGWLALGLAAGPRDWRRARLPASLAAFTLAFALVIAPQVGVNLRDTGQPFYNQQAKNVWLAVFGDGDWGRWGEASNDVSLGQVALQDPERFFGNLWANLRGFVGSGAEDTSEFGRAMQLRLLAFPANWLAAGGLLAWCALLLRGVAGRRSSIAAGMAVESQRREPLSSVRSLPVSLYQTAPGWRRRHPAQATLLLWIGLYVCAISVGFALPRFFLPLAPAYAIAAAWLVQALCGWVWAQTPHIRSRALAAGLLVAALVWGGFGTGASYVLRASEAGDTMTPGQNGDTLAMARLVLRTLAPGESLIALISPADDAGTALTKYSAIAHRVLPPPAELNVAGLRASGARYLLWSDRQGPAPALGAPIGRAGPYALYEIN